MYICRFILLVALLLFALPAQAAETGQLAGRVTGTDGEALVGVNVVAIGTELGAATDADGRYVITDLPAGSHTFEFSMIGYRTLTRAATVISGQPQSLNVKLPVEALAMAEVVVTPGHYGISRQTGNSEDFMRVEEVKTTAGTAGDVFMALSTMPGVAAMGPSAPIYVQGGSAEENLVLMDHAWVANAFHMDLGGGGVYSLFNSAILRNVNLYTGGFGAEFGDRLSSAMVVETRDGATDRLRGTFSLSTAFAELVAEGPIPGTQGKGSLIVSARRSYFDFFIKLSKEYADMFEVFPNYYDLAARVNYRLSGNHQLIVSGLWASDNAILLLDTVENDLTARTTWNSSKGIAELSLNSLLTANLTSRLVVSVSEADIKHEVDTLWHNRVAQTVPALREDITWQVHEDHLVKAGFTADARHRNDDVAMPIVKTGLERLRPDLPVSVLDTSLGTVYAGGYITDNWRLAPWLTFAPGLRVDQLAANAEWTASPRLGAALNLTAKQVLRLGWGLYHQTPRLQDLAADDGDLRLHSRRAWHYVAGLESELPLELTARLEGFYKKFERLPLNLQPTGLSDSGHGYAYGSGLLVQRQLAKDLRGWVSYAWTVARRQENYDTGLVAPDFDVRHMVTAVGTYELGRGWQLGAKWQYGSGQPATPLVGAYRDTLTGYYQPIAGDRNSARMPAYHSLDLRLLKGWTFRAWSLSAFVEALNAYNHANVSGYAYNRDYSVRIDKPFYGTIPSIGLIAQF